MKNKLKSFFKKYQIAILCCIGVLTIGLLIVFLVISLIGKTTIKEYKNDNYILKYDSNWKIKDPKDDSIRLVYNNDSEINIQIVPLEEEYKYASSDELLDELLYDLGLQNENYKLLSSEESLITKYKYNGYKLLYEGEDSQALVMMGKQADKVLLITYEASNTYFDILLDSVQNIVYDFQILDDIFETTYELAIETSDIEWSDNDEIDNLDETKEYEIAYNNYLVNYAVPVNFKLNSFDSTNNAFNYENLDKGDITLNVNIRNMNIYRYLDENGSYSNLYRSYSTQREGKSGYSNFKEALQKLDGDKLSYIYKNSYDYSSEYGDSTYEEVILLYELDKSHVLEFSFKARNTTIPKKLVDSIKLVSFKNYSSYIKRNVVDGNVTGELKEYFDYNKDKLRVITLRLPEKYREIDKKYNNMYENRFYGLNYDEDKNIYQYEVEYKSDVYSVESGLKACNTMYYDGNKNNGSSVELTYSRDITLNGKTFKVYTGGYTDLADDSSRTKYYVNNTVLFYQYAEDKFLTIDVKGNDIEVSDAILNELANFDIETQEI